MTRATSGRAVALRDQLAAILRDSATPLSTRKLALRAGMPWVQFGIGGCCSVVHALAKRRGWRIVVCRNDGEHRVAEPPSAETVYRHLVALEATGVIVRVLDPDRESIEVREGAVTLGQHIAKYSGTRCLYWQYVASTVDETFASLISVLGER
ncbi:MAG: hypothetical protein WCE30_00950 [Mycobacterium sp.]